MPLVFFRYHWQFLSTTTVTVFRCLRNISTEKAKEESVDSYTDELKRVPAPIRKDNFVTARKILRNICGTCLKSDNLKEELEGWLKRNYEDARKSYDSFLYNETSSSVLNVKPIAPLYSDDSPVSYT